MRKTVIIIGGGAAGFFAAINIAERHSDYRVIILEKTGKVLQKVRISGGGRCNVTHACFDPKELVTYYPRGEKELLGPFHQFMTGDTMQWFEDRGVTLKIESDNRIFPTSNSSQTIIDCLVESADESGVALQLNQNVKHIEPVKNRFQVTTDTDEFLADSVVVTSGSSPKFWDLLSGLGHKIIPPVPSLFTFKINDSRIKDIPGVSVPNATVKLAGSKFIASGPLLITHWGISGPAVLKLSAFGALFLADKNYQYNVQVNWLSKSKNDVIETLKSFKVTLAKSKIYQKSPFQEIPKRLWVNLLASAEVREHSRWADITNKQLANLSDQLVSTLFNAKGKSTFKEEFVTAGGVNLKEINFKRFESKIHKNLFFAGEVLNVDAVTGGFNFQNAWTGAYIISKSIGNN